MTRLWFWKISPATSTKECREFGSDASGNTGGRLHRALDQPFTDCSFHSNFVNGRHSWPVISRIQFPVTLSIAILVSLCGFSPTTTPMLCRYFLRRHQVGGSRSRPGPDLFDRMRHGYARSLRSVLRYRGVVLLIFAVTICLNVTLFIVVPKGLFPQQDTGRLYGRIQADQGISFRAMSEKFQQVMTLPCNKIQAVESVVGFTGAGSGWGGSSNTAAQYSSRLSQNLNVRRRSIR